MASTNGWARFIQVTVSVLLVLLPLGTGALAWALVLGSGDPGTKDRMQLVAADIFVPMFTAVVGLLAATATVKGLLTVWDNVQRAAHNKEPQPIRLFEW
jgi:hypothetical protein